MGRQEPVQYQQGNPYFPFFAVRSSNPLNARSTLAHLLVLNPPIMTHPPSTLFKLIIPGNPLVSIHCHTRPYSASSSPLLPAALLPLSLTSGTQSIVRPSPAALWLAICHQSGLTQPGGRMKSYPFCWRWRSVAARVAGRRAARIARRWARARAGRG